jgi:hypothetical protein
VALAVAIAVGQPAVSRAFSTGIPSTVFGLTGCPLCHSGGLTPSVLLSGPTVVAPGSTADYTLTIFDTNPAQNFGGLNVAASAGTLSTGGVFASDTRTIIGLLGLVEITHVAPEQADFLNEVEFSFRWTAPANFTSATLRGWGNAVNHDGFPTGDAASLTTLDIAASIPTPTPTPFICGDAAPLDPPLVADRGAQVCQAAIARAGMLYVKKSLNAARACLAKAVGGDPLTVCVGDATTAPTDPAAATAIAKAEMKLRAILFAKCSDAALVSLAACAATESGLETCLLAQHRQAVIDTVANDASGAPSADKGVRRCQNALRAAADGYLAGHLVAGARCLAARNKAATPGDGAALCVGAIVGGAFVAPTDAKAAAAVATAQAKLGKAIQRSCDEGDIASLDVCGSDRTSEAACLLCTHRATVFGLLSSEFGGAP